VVDQQPIVRIEGVQRNNESDNQKRNDKTKSNSDPIQKCNKMVAAAHDIFQKLKSGKILLTNDNGDIFIFRFYIITLF
jgi:hypothetical protein